MVVTNVELVVENDCLVVRLWVGSTEVAHAALRLDHLAHMIEVAKYKSDRGIGRPKNE